MSRLRDRRLELLGVGVVLVLLSWLYWFVPWLGEKRTALVSTPSPFAVGEPDQIRLGAGEEACLNSVAFTPDTEFPVIKVFTAKKPAVPLTITAKADDGSYRAEARQARYVDGIEVGTLIATPREEVLGEFCVRNDGDRDVWLAGSRETKTQARGGTKVAGVQQPGDMSVQFYERRDESVSERLSWLVDRMAIWTPGGPAIHWLLLALVVVAVPAGVLWAFASSVRAEEP